MSGLSSKQLDDMGDALSRWFESQEIDTAIGTLVMLRLIAKLVVRKDPDPVTVVSGANIVMKALSGELIMVMRGQ